MINHGLVEEQIISKQDYFLGSKLSLAQETVDSRGSWIKYLPKDEIQAKNGIETNSCVSFGILNAIEILMKAKFGSAMNYSDRYLAIASETKQNGNTITKVCETLRKISGCVEEELLPFDENITTYEQFFSPIPLNKKYYDKGREWLNRYDFGHEWVNTDKNSLCEGLTYSPLGVSVLAWAENEEGLYFKPQGAPNNHFTLLVDYEWNKHWVVYDTYPGSDGKFIKYLDWNYEFGNTKRFSIDIINKKNCFNLINDYFWSILK